MNITERKPSKIAFSLSIRDYREEDYSLIEAIWQKVEMTPFTQTELRRLLAVEGRALVAEIIGSQHQIVGVVLWSHNGRSAMLWRLAVDPDFHGKGIGKALVRRAENDIRELGFEQAGLLVKDNNEAAKSLYSKSDYADRSMEYWSKNLG